MKLFLSTIILFVLCSFSYAQDFGDVSEEELTMTLCTEEPDADVVILFDKCIMKITRDFDLIADFHTRIKILTEKGKEYANVKLSYWNDDKINDLDAVCYSPDGEEYELDSDNIFVEKGEKFTTISFAIPGVEIGSVIEYEYRHWSDDLFRLDPWVFQDRNFTKLSQLELYLQKGFSYNNVTLNTQFLDFKMTSDKIINPDNPHAKISRFTWKGKNVPGLKEEPFVDNFNDNYAKMYFILNSYQDSYSKLDFTKTWDNMAEILSKRFNKFIDQSGDTEDKAIEITKNETDPLIKANLIYNFVKSEIKLTDHKILFSDDFKEPNKVLDTKEGSSSDKNMLLINMLTHCGLDAKPLFISTRKNGFVVKDYVDYAQFNRLICRLVINNKTYFLNAGLKSNPFGYLTPSTDVGLGLLLDDDKGQIISVTPLKPLNKTKYNTELVIENESVKASTSITYNGYKALLERNDLEDKIESDIKEKVEEIIKDLYASAVLDSFYYSGVEKYDDPLVLNLTYTLPDYIHETDELVYFAFPFFSAITDNPFKRDYRQYSIDFNYTNLIAEEIKLILPSNLTLVEVPKNSKAGINNYTYSRTLFSSKDYIKCSRIKNLRVRNIHPKLYLPLKEMYSTMISSDQEQLVFKKIDSRVGANTEGTLK
jgi:hypothetical protein